MFFSMSWERFERRALLSSWANPRIARRGAALVPLLLLLQLAAAHATPLAPSAGCVPSPYTTGDLTCTNSGTVNATGTDGIDPPANNGNATTTNSGNVNVNVGSGGGIIGIRTTTDIGQATTNNSGNVNVTGSGFNFGIVTSTTFSVGIQFGANTMPETSSNAATTNNSGNVNLTSSGGSASSRRRRPASQLRPASATASSRSETRPRRIPAMSSLTAPYRHLF